MMKILLLSLLCMLLAVPQASAMREVTATSPDGKTQVTQLTDANGRVYYRVSYDGTAAIDRIDAALVLNGGKTLGATQAGMRGAKTARGTAHYNTLTASWGKCKVVFRVYNKGVAYRFETDYPDSITIDNEIADFTFSDDYKAYEAMANSRDKKATDFQHQAMCSFENTSTPSIWAWRPCSWSSTAAKRCCWASTMCSTILAPLWCPLAATPSSSGFLAW